MRVRKFFDVAINNLPSRRHALGGLAEALQDRSTRVISFFGFVRERFKPEYVVNQLDKIVESEAQIDALTRCRRSAAIELEQNAKMLDNRAMSGSRRGRGF